MQIKKAIKKGFTLVELVVVIAVIAILAATSVGVYFGMLESANRSADQQAVVQMNKILLLEDTLGDVDNILDVHKAFERNGLSTEHYTALAKDHTFYYDTDYNKILYVNNSGDNLVVEYPEEHKDQTWVTRSAAGAQWFSLNLSIKEEAPAPSSITKNEAGLTATVSSASEFAYVMREARSVRGADKVIDITVSGELDLMGANVTIPVVETNFTLKGTNGATIKNLTSNSYSLQNNEGKIYGAGIIGLLKGHEIGGLVRATIENITVENVHIDGVDSDAGGCGVLIGGNDTWSSVTIKNVTIKNSTVAGNRSVGAVIGQNDNPYGNAGNHPHLLEKITLNNVDVYTDGGRSSLVIGHSTLNHGKYVGEKIPGTNETFKTVEEVFRHFTKIVEVTADSNCEFLPYEGKAVKTIDTIDSSVHYYYDASYNSNTYLFNDAPTRNKYYCYESTAFASFTIEGSKLGFIAR